MRTAEMTSAVFFTVFLIAALVVPLPPAKRRKAIGIGGAGWLVILLLPRLDAVPGGSIFRDFVPGLLLLIGYWQTGALVQGGHPPFQAFLERFDRRWLPGTAPLRARIRRRPLLWSYFEVSYLACYAVVPLAVGVLHLSGHAHAVDQFWRVVLPATFATHALTTVFQARPPWMAHARSDRATGASGVGWLNQWVTNHASIRFNSFPSGHVACASAVGLVLLEVLPAAGIVFLWIAGSIAVATLLLRHHYGLDVVLGIALALASFTLAGMNGR